jgi:hypothetical protein
MEETMRVLTVIELMRLSKIELCDLAAKINQPAAGFPGRLTRTRSRAHQPAQHPHRSGPARLLTLKRATPPLPVFTSRGKRAVRTTEFDR